MHPRVITIPQRAGGRGTRQRRELFYVGLSAALLIAIAFGFGWSYYLRSYADLPPLPPRASVLHLQSLAFTGWALLFLVQTWLIAARRTALHRWIGVLGAMLALGVIAVGVASAVHGGRTGFNPAFSYPDALGFMAVPLTDVLLFAGFVAPALVFRRRAELHKRFMLLGTVGGLLRPAMAHLPYIGEHFLPMLLVLSLFLIAGPLHDLRTRKSVHPVYVWGGLLILASLPLRRVIGVTAAWHEFASWLIR